MKRLLFIAYYFPPSGGPGVQRSLKFVKYLQEFGWQPSVITVRPDQASFPDLDPALNDEIPASTRVEGTSAWDPYAWYARLLGRRKGDVVSVGFLGESQPGFRQRLARGIRANLFLPDARVGWIPFAATRARACMAQDSYDAILTTGPPHSTHLVGLLLHRLHRIPWLADFRDPWTRISYYAELPMMKPARALDAWLEKLVLGHADACTVVSESIGRCLRNRTREAPVVIWNGFDPADFQGFDPSALPPAKRFLMGYVGTMNEAQSPHVLWKVLGDLIIEQPARALGLRFTGNVDPAVLAAASHHGLGSLIETVPYVSHGTAIEHMRASTLLLLCINRVEGAEGIVTGKLFEYLAAGRPIVGIGPPDGDAARILRETEAGRMFDFDDEAGLGAYLRAQIDAWSNGRAVGGARPDRIARYSRRVQTEALAEVLSRIAAASPSSDHGRRS